ncbi:DUF6455 family protein [Litorivita pollutaquae]|uniref:DUF6455 family protein n=1 Tax=Litorivita pollutaquae TaxID=2200892 RepID=UPI0019553A67|nr:DUF6455 family protein [Litorivita pollutaquae]
MTQNSVMPPKPVRALGPSIRHYWRVKRMARATGTDLIAAFEAGDLDARRWAQVVDTCRGCAWVNGCARWLAQADAAARAGGAENVADTAPDACLNRGLFANLKALQLAGCLPEPQPQFQYRIQSPLPLPRAIDRRSPPAFQAVHAHPQNALREKSPI